MHCGILLYFGGEDERTAACDVRLHGLLVNAQLIRIQGFSLPRIFHALLNRPLQQTSHELGVASIHPSRKALVHLRRRVLLRT